MKTIVVASHNPVKLAAMHRGFARMFPGEEVDVQGVSVPSGVADQPMTSAETLQGALNRARSVREHAPQADYWAGIEGGVDTAESVGAQGDGLVAFAWVVVTGIDASGAERCGRGCTGLFFLPPRVAELVHQGKELGEADDIVFGRSNSKQENGAVGLLTGDVIDRAGFYEQAVILALIPFRNPDLY